MDKIYTAQDIKNVIATVEELSVVNAKLEELIYRGSNDEKLVERKRELERSNRKFNPIVLEHEEPIFGVIEDKELTLLKSDYESVVSRLKERKLKLEAEIKILQNGS